MQTRTIVIEQRLRTTWIVTLLTMAMVAVVGIGSAIEAFSFGSAAGLYSGLVDLVVLAGLAGALVLALRVVVRVVEAPEGRALEVVYGPSGSVRQYFDHATIASARPRRLSAVQTGGWGYRGSLKLFKRAAVVSRSGDALELQLKNGRRFSVTVDEPQDFATALGL